MEGMKNEWGTNKIAMHEESLRGMMETMKGFGDKPLQEKPIEEIRADANRMALAMQQPEFDGTIENRCIPSKEVKDGIPVRIYKPANLPATPKIWVYFHAGGYIMGNLEIGSAMHKTLAPLGGMVIVDVDYRLAPETKLPGCMDDCAEVTQWVMDNRTEVGGVLESPVGVGGSSAGGLNAIYVSHKVKGVAFQILIYPGTDMTCKSPSYKEFETPGMTETSDWMINQCMPEGAPRDDPRWSPVYHQVADCVGQPPTLFVLSQIDVVRDDGRRYAKLLIDAGVFTTVSEIKGAHHGFCYDPARHPTLCGLAYRQIATFLSGI